LREALGRIAQGTTLLAIGGLLAFSGWLVMLAAAILGLSTVVPAWLAALIVGAAVLVSAGVLLYLGKTRFDGQSLVPQRTLRTLRDDEAWLRGWMR
jgi:predicted phage tail protein